MCVNKQSREYRFRQRQAQGRTTPGLRLREKTDGTFASVFIDDLTRVWKEQGADILQKVATEQPVQFLKICASLMPKDVNIDLKTEKMVVLDFTGVHGKERQAIDLDDEDVEVIDAPTTTPPKS
jgi:hypothetical protein